MSAPRGPLNHTDQQARELHTLQQDILKGRLSPPEVRLAEQLRDLFGKWDDILTADLKADLR